MVITKWFLLVGVVALFIWVIYSWGYSDGYEDATEEAAHKNTIDFERAYDLGFFDAQEAKLYETADRGDMNAYDER